MHLLGELEARARELLDVAHYDYFAGGAGDEQTIAENAAAWRKLWIRPRVMVDVSAVDTSSTLLGRRLALPVLLAPMAAQRLLHPDGEPAAARAAGAAGTVYCLSTRATRTSPRSPPPRAGRCGFSSTSTATASAPSRCSRASPSTASTRCC